jgi:outer membrane protein OmpA-like peptidoglycan-associated protein
MNRTLSVTLAALVFAVAAVAQTQEQNNTLMQAQQVISAAETAGAATYATSLLEDARWRLRSAQDHWNSDKRSTREQARLHAEQAVWAGRATLAKTQWLATAAAVRGLQDDIRHFGGQSTVIVEEEPPTLEIQRGKTSADRIRVAEVAIQQAKAAGAERVAGNDLKPAEAHLETARKIVKNDRQSENADHLAYVAEMMARRAYYLARAAEINPLVTNLQAERTRLANEASAREAAAERARREEAERQAADLEQQIAARTAQDRAAREEAERRLDEMIQRYQAALSSATSAEAEALRRQVEDQQITLRSIQERERLNEESMQTQIDALRRELEAARQQGTSNSQLLAERQAELERREQEFQRLRREREEDLAKRLEVEQQQAATITEAQRTRQAAEARAAELEQQVVAAQQQTQATQAELDRTRQQLAERDAEARRLRLEQELSRLAATRVDPRGLIVTLPGIFFDTGKHDLKPGARNTLTKITEQLRTDDTIRVAIEGHTDSVGSESSNQALSERRAGAVRDFLVNNGLPAERISASGRGESVPVASNKTASGRQQNRRVELIITH